MQVFIGHLMRSNQLTAEGSYLPSQLAPLGSSENPRWHSQVKLPGVFWQMPFDPHRLMSEAFIVICKKQREKGEGGLPQSSLCVV